MFSKEYVTQKVSGVSIESTCNSMYEKGYELVTASVCEQYAEGSRYILVFKKRKCEKKDHSTKAIPSIKRLV